MAGMSIFPIWAARSRPASVPSPTSHTPITHPLHVGRGLRSARLARSPVSSVYRPIRKGLDKKSTELGPILRVRVLAPTYTSRIEKCEILNSICFGTPEATVIVIARIDAAHQELSKEPTLELVGRFSCRLVVTESLPLNARCFWLTIFPG